MSDESRRIAKRTAANANLLSILGDILSSDGTQSMRVPLGTPGQYLGVDLTAECGVSWSTPGGGVGSLTFSDGVTRAADNVTNDLVTGAFVDQVNAKVDFSVADSIFLMSGVAGNVALFTGDDGAGRGTFSVHAGPIAITADDTAAITADEITLEGIINGVTINTQNASDFTVNSSLAVTLLGVGAFRLESSSAGGNIQTADDLAIKTFGGNGSIILSTTGTGDVAVNPNRNFDVTAVDQVLLTAQGGDEDAINLDATDGGFIASNDTGSRFTIGSAGGIAISGSGLTAQIDISSSSGNDINITTAGTGDFNVTSAHDEVHTVGRNFTLAAVGSGGVSIEATNGNLTLDAGPGDGTAEVRVMPTAGVPAATRTFRIWNGVGDGQGTILSPSGGATVDANCRAALDDLLTQLHAWGWLTNPNP